MTNKLLVRAAQVLGFILGVVQPGLTQSKAPPGPAPGTLVEIGGHKLHVHCAGPADARPAVIFESGGGGFSTRLLTVIPNCWQKMPAGTVSTEKA